MYKILGADQKEYGPVTLEQLQQWITEGRANTQTLVQGPNSTEWKPLGSFPEVGVLAASVPPPSASSYPTTSATPNIPNYLWQSIVVTLCCCLPLGIPAIVFAAQVTSKQAAGDIAGAMKASSTARMWCWIALGAGLVTNLIFVILQSMGALAQFNL